jgi:hypothetical protein
MSMLNPHFFFILFIILISFHPIFGQNEAKPNEVGKMQFGVNFSPDINYRRLYANEKSSFTNFTLNYRDENELAKLSLSTGFNFCYQVNSFFGIETGVQYANKGYTAFNLGLAFEPRDSNDPGIPFDIISVYSYHFFDFPLRVNFTIGKKDVRFFSSVGLIVNGMFRTTRTDFLTFSDRTEKRKFKIDEGFNRFNVSSLISLGVDYRLTEKTNLRLEPTFRYTILPITNTPITAQLYNVGLNMGYYFGF